MIKIPEYMAMGKPVVSYGLAESRVSAADAATYADDDTPEALGRCLNELLDDPEKMARMGALGRQRVVSELGWEHSESALLAAYGRALEGAAAPSRKVRRTRAVDGLT
jgi:glycosyltransferase involved in cell wall biosynthesis